MAFPTSPTIGQQHSEYGDTYTWDGSVWTAGGAAVLPDGRVIHIDEAEPSDSTEGAIWYRLDLSAVATKRSAVWNNIVQSRSIGAPWTENTTPSEPETPPSEPEAPPAGPTYSASVPVSTVDEGTPVTVSVATTNVAEGTTLYWTEFPSGQFEVASGSITIDSNGEASFDVTPLADETTEGEHSGSIAIRTDSISGEVVAYVEFFIGDTSETPAPAAGTMTIRQKRGRPEVTEGASNRIDVLISTTGYVGETFTWVLTGITADDLYDESYSMTGSFTVTTDPQNSEVQLRFKGADGVENENCTFTVNETGASFTFPVIDNPSTL